MMDEARIRVTIAADGLSATVRVVPGAAAAVTSLDQALADAGISFGVEQELRAQLGNQLADERFAVEEAVIARGRAAQPSEDGYFAPAFHMGIEPGHVRPDGTMDFLDRELLKPVQAGQAVGQLHPERPGAPGRRVDGSELQVAPARACKLTLGPGVSLQSDGRVLALRAGVLRSSGPRAIDVVQQHVHSGDVDLRSGHLDMEGSLVVRGSVERLFRATATGDVEVQGGVEYGSVHAGGSVRVGGVVRGGDTGMLSAGGDVSARRGEYALIMCTGLVKMESALHCELAAHTIQVTGSVRGGRARAEHGLNVGDAGAAQGTDTLLCAGVPLEHDALEAKRAVQAAKDQRSLHKGGREERGKGGKAGRLAAALASAELERKIAHAERCAALVAEAYVEINGTAQPGTRVQLGTATYAVDEPIKSVRFVFDPGTRGVRAERYVR